MGEMSSLGVIHVELVVTTRSPWKVIKKDWGGGRGVLEMKPFGTQALRRKREVL